MPQLNSYRVGPDPGYLVVVVNAPFSETARTLRGSDLPARAADVSGVVFDLRLTDGVSDEIRAVLTELSDAIGFDRVALAGAAGVVHDALPSIFPVVRAATLDEAIARLGTDGRAAATPAPTPAPVTSDSTAAGTVRVLLCDDDSGMRDLVRAQLEIDGMSVVGECANGRDAIDRANSTRPDVVILDVHMPVMSGLDALPELRRAAPHAKILMLTASDSDDVQTSALASGAHMYLRKSHPFEIPRMVRLVTDTSVDQPDVVIARWE